MSKARVRPGMWQSTTFVRLVTVSGKTESKEDSDFNIAVSLSLGLLPPCFFLLSSSLLFFLFLLFHLVVRASLVAQMVKHLPAMQETNIKFMSVAMTSVRELYNPKRYQAHGQWKTEKEPKTCVMCTQLYKYSFIYSFFLLVVLISSYWHSIRVLRFQKKWFLPSGN